MRVELQNDQYGDIFSKQLIDIGNGEFPIDTLTGCINFPQSFCQLTRSKDELIQKVFPDVAQNYRNHDWLSERAILAAKNIDVNELNFKIQEQITGELRIYKSVDSATNQDDVVNYPPEFLNSLDLPGLPPHNLQLKVGSVVIMLRNINQPRLCNGTRLAIKKLLNNVIEATILKGKYKGEDVLIPRIPMIPTDVPFEFKRLQFPVRLAFAMTINKSQGQSLGVCGINLENPCFSHGQLYVACSRVGKPSDLFVYSPEGSLSGPLVTNKKFCGPENYPSCATFGCNISEVNDGSESDTSNSDTSQPNLFIGFDSPSTSQMRMGLQETAVISQRYGVSDRATAMLVNSVLKDVGLISSESRNLITDKNKIRREKNLVRREIQLKDRVNAVAPKALYFDGRKDDTYIQVKRGNKFYRQVIKEEHISILSEPGSQYLAHVTPKSGSAVDITDSIYEAVMKEDGFEELTIVGCDGTAVNTGPKGGILRCLEDKLGRSLQWSICLLHFNELPFRSIFQFIDGVTSGPKSFSGQIGSKLNGCENLEVVKYAPINCELPDILTMDYNITKHEKKNHTS